MKQSLILRAAELYPGSLTVRKYSFKTVDTRGESAHFQIKDCFECLSPIQNAA
jgi:hypothetical protein